MARQRKAPSANGAPPKRPRKLKVPPEYVPFGRPEPAEPPPLGTDLLPWYTGTDLPREMIGWLWEGYLPRGVPSLLYGPSNRGKSTLARYIVAALTRGEGLPGMKPKRPVPVLWYAAEEDYRSVVAPRLEAAGADMRYLHFPDELRDGSKRTTLILDSGRHIQAAVERTKAGLVVFDAIFDFAGGSQSPFCNDTAQACMQALADMGRQTGAGFLGIAFPKKGGRGPALEAISGGMYWMNRARAALLNAPHPTEPKTAFLICSKPALCETPPALRWRLSRVNGLPRLDWEGEADVTPETVSQGGEAADEEAATGDAVGFLRVALDDEPQPVNELQRRGKENGLSIFQLYRARLKLGVKQEWKVDGDRKESVWSKPEKGWPQ